MSIKRYYGDSGLLLKVEMSKEMKARVARYYKKTKRAQFMDTVVMPALVIILGIGLIIAYYLILN